MPNLSRSHFARQTPEIQANGSAVRKRCYGAHKLLIVIFIFKAPSEPFLSSAVRTGLGLIGGVPFLSSEPYGSPSAICQWQAS